MGRLEDRRAGADRQESPISLTDDDIGAVRVDRRSFLSRAVAAGSIAAAAALTTACPSGTDSDGAGDAEAPAAGANEATDADQAETEEASDSDGAQ